MNDINNKEKYLVSRLIKSDEEAFCALYSLYKKRIISFSLKFVKSEEFAEDIFHDTFTALWQTRHFLDNNIAISSYLYTIARNRILNILRDLSPEDKLHDFILSQAIDHSEDVFEKVSTSELKSIILQAINKLTKRQREVFEMSRYDGMSHEEIAQALGISVYTVQEHISAALKTLQSTVHKKYGMQMVLLIVTTPSFIFQ